MSYRRPRHDSADDATTPSYPDWMRTTLASICATPMAVRRWRTSRSTRKAACPAATRNSSGFYAAEAEPNCPVSPALAGIPEIVLTAKLV
jgi:hypothetical protein